MKTKFFFLFIGLMFATFSYFLTLEGEKHLTDQKEKATAVVNLYDIPLYFEENQGQIASEVKYLTRCPGHCFYFAPNEVTMVMQGKEKGAVLKVQFVESNSPFIKGIEEQECKTSYFIGSSENWKTAIPNFAKVLYQNLYPGIDAIFYGNGKQLEYDFCVSPNGDPRNVLLHFEGAQKLSVNQEGNLDIFMEEEIIAQMKKPFIYQMNGKEKQEIEGQFVLAANNSIRFLLSGYDATKQLVIDPILTYSTYLGGSGFFPLADQGNSIAVNSDGNAYITGFTNSTNFPTTTGAFQTTFNIVSTNAFITKLNSGGTGLSYSTYLGGSLNDQGASIAIDSTGNAYITGITSSTDFPTTTGAFQTTPTGGQNAFITKLNSGGTGLSYSTYLGGGSINQGSSIVIDTSGNAYVTGSTSSTNFPTTTGAFQTTATGGQNAFIAKLNSGGTGLSYSTYLGGSLSDQGNGIAIDSTGNAYIAGSTSSTDFPTTTGAFQTTFTGSPPNAFITKLNSGGTGLSYSTYLGGSLNDQANSIAIDSTGNAYITGVTSSTNFPTTAGAFQTNHTNFAPIAFITKLNSGGTGLSYSTYLGGTATNQGSGIVIMSGEAYVTGSTSSTNFPTTAGAFQTSFGGGSNDAFFSRMNSGGTGLIYSTYLGGTNTDQGSGIAINSSENVYIIGSTKSTDFPTTTGAFQTTNHGPQNAFIANFTFLIPSITGVFPNQGPFTGGTVVTITGTNFTDATNVYFGDTAAASFIVNSDIEIIALSPPHAVGTVDITVSNLDGTSPLSPEDEFTFIPQKPATTTTLSISPNPAFVGQAITFTASVSPSDATGEVIFFNGNFPLGTASLSSGIAVLTFDNLAAGQYLITAVYEGDSTYASSTSNVVNLSVKLKPSFIQFQVSSNCVVEGENVTLTATVFPSAATGTVLFFDGIQLIDVKELVGGVASLKTKILKPGNHFLIASYSGNATFLGSLSQVITLKVKPIPLSSSEDSSSSEESKPHKNHKPNWKKEEKRRLQKKILPPFPYYQGPG